MLLGACAINSSNPLPLRNGLGRVAVAHTANDQAETLLAHLFRGNGSSGTRGNLSSSWSNHSPFAGCWARGNSAITF